MIPYSQAKTIDMSNTGGGISQIMEGATATTDGQSGAVPQPKAGDNYRFLRGDGTWSAAQGEAGTGITNITQNPDYTLTISMSDGTSYDTDPVKGEKGDKGDTGAQGAKGDKGDKGEKGEQGEQGIQGEKGDKGDKGDKGQDGTVEFDDLTPEQKASLKGDKGDTGATPNITANGSITGDTGTPSVNVSRSGTNENPVLSFTFNNIKGSKGDTGNAGIGIQSIVKTSTVENVDTYTITMTDGSTATFTVTNAIAPVIQSETLTAGNVTVTFTNIPTSGNYLIDFFTSNGVNYKTINTSVPGQVTLTFEVQSEDITVSCSIQDY